MKQGYFHFRQEIFVVSKKGSALLCTFIGIMNQNLIRLQKLVANLCVDCSKCEAWIGALETLSSLEIPKVTSVMYPEKLSIPLRLS